MQIIILDRTLIVLGVERPAGEPFEVEDKVAIELMAKGRARKAQPPRILYDTKVIVPEAAEVRARSSSETKGKLTGNAK